MEVRPDLEEKRRTASTTKNPLRMEKAERDELMEILLRISKISMEAFDMIEADELSEADVFLILQLPDWCNAFTRRVEAHARNRARESREERQRQRTSYMGTNKGAPRT